MTILLITFSIAVLVEIGLPLVLAITLRKRLNVGWVLFGVGMLTFIGSQVIHLPLLSVLTALFQQGILPQPSLSFMPYFNAIVLGLAAGICEEPARCVGYKLLRKKGDSFPAALMLGAGHGGIESIFIGVTVLVNVVLMTLSKLNGVASLGLDAATAAAVSSQMDAFWGIAWHLPFAGMVERIFAISLHLSLSVMVWAAVTRRFRVGKLPQWIWFVVAVLWHAVVDALSVYLSNMNVHFWAIEAIIGVCGVLSLAAAYLIYKKTTAVEVPAVEQAPAEPVLPLEPDLPVEESADEPSGE